jgi:hypothetical protein
MKHFCDNEACENKAVQQVYVSENCYQDSTRWYCHACVEVFFVGVQHGGFRERAGKGREAVTV